MARRHGSDWYRSRAKTLKKWGLLPGVDLRRSKAGAFTAREKSKISRLWKATEPVHNLDVKVIRVKKSTKTGNRMRVKNSVFVAREGAQRITWNKKTGTIVKTIKQNGSVKRIRAPMNPRPEDAQAHFDKLKKNQTGMLRSSTGKGITEGGYRYDRKTWSLYAQERFNQIMVQKKRQGMKSREAKKYAQQILDSWYVVEIEEEGT
jgi:hypothetical protein